MYNHRSISEPRFFHLNEALLSLVYINTSCICRFTSKAAVFVCIKKKYRGKKTISSCHKKRDREGKRKRDAQKKERRKRTKVHVVARVTRSPAPQNFVTRRTAGVRRLGQDFLNKIGRKRHASEYLADSGSVSSASTSKMPSRG